MHSSSNEDDRDLKKLAHDDYTVGWIAVLDCELDAARLLLDDEHERLDSAGRDPNNYILGDMEGHNIAIAYPGEGSKGVSAATFVASNMLRTFQKIRFGLLVGVAGGAPGPPDPNDARKDIRLGDVVVSCPVDDNLAGGVRQVDYGKQLALDEFKPTGHLNKPPPVLLTGVKTLRSDLRFRRARMNQNIQTATKTAGELEIEGHLFPGWHQDQLFRASYSHLQTAEGKPNPDCSGCDTGQIEIRRDRTSVDPAVHYGLIASGNQVVRSAKYRDDVREKFGILCFEMEAAGLMDTFPCLVVRGISDYSDGHKNKVWQPYAATTAAAYAKDLLRVVWPSKVEKERLVIEVVDARK